MLVLLLQLFFTDCFFHVGVFCYYCQNKQIDIFGQTGPLLASLFSTTKKPYEDFRKSYSFDINMEIVPGDFYVNSGLVGTVQKDTPVVFAGTHHNFSLNTNEVKFPLLAQAVVVIYNLPNVTNLNLSLQIISDIYKGNILHWNSSIIATHNPNATLPSTRILPIARIDSDATTALFTQVLSESDDDWGHKYGWFFEPNFVGNISCNSKNPTCNSTSWPPNVIHMYGNKIEGMIGIAASVPYSIGYATINMIGRNKISVVNLINTVENNSDIVIKSDQANVEKAVRYFLNETKSDDLRLTFDNVHVKNGYPMTAFSYMVMNFSYDNTIDCCVVQELVGFLDWLYYKSDKNLLIDIGYVPIIDEIRTRVKKLVMEKVRCREGSVYSLYLATLDPSSVFEIWKVAVILAAALVAICIFAASSYFVYTKKFYVDESRWTLDPNRIKMHHHHSNSDTKNKLIHSDSESIVSDGSELPGRPHGSKNKSSSRSTSANPSGDHHQHGVVKELKEFMIRGKLDENKVYLDLLVCKIPQQWTNRTKRTMNKLQNIINKNVSTLMGISVINSAPYAVFEFCPKGTLHYMLRTSRYHLTDEIKFSFALDVAQGLKYLHHHGFVHGYLNSISCYLDSSWSVKIAQWEKLPIYRDENFREISEYATHIVGTVFEEDRLIELIYVDPKLLTNIDETVDIFSFGYLLIEIFSRKLPYLDEVEEDGHDSYSDILSKKFNHLPYPKPRASNISKDITSLAYACISSEDKRPNMSKICSQLRRSGKISDGIVDVIMDTLESHADALEEKVEERTSELKQVTNNMRNLLNDVLPPQITDKLLKGEEVLPEQFECITVYFSDIVGFAAISAKSSPTEVMTLLNELWIAFDSIIDKFDVYKADTIGDAYMVCSGLPQRNGNEHCRQIVLLAMALLEMCNEFKIKHMPNEKLKIKIGINCGPATAGVVGSKMPQYCVFGDTVNTASRMESTSLARRIQISEKTNVFLNQHFANLFEITFRGEITVKGKGTMRTYWLHNPWEES